jgi:hypothetical protein
MEIERAPSSALIKRLREAGRAKPRRLGFARRDDDRAAPSIVLIAEVAGLDPEGARAATAAGAAAIAFVLDRPAVAALARGDTPALVAAIEACGDAIAGLTFSADTMVPADLVERAGDADFAIAAVERAPAALLRAEKLALVAQVEASIDRPALLRAVGELKVDAVLALPRGGSQHGAGLSLLDLMAYKLATDSARQPVLALADSSIRPEDLQPLRDVGVDGVVLPAGARIRAFADAAARVKVTRRASPAGDAAPFIPRTTARASAAERSDDDEDD